MRLEKTSFGFKATDGSGLIFNCDQARNVESIDKIRACKLFTDPQNGQYIWLDAAELQHIRTVKSEHRSESGKPGWTSNIIYSLYERIAPPYTEQQRKRLLKNGLNPDAPRQEGPIVIARQSGLGPQFFVIDQLEAHHVYPALAATLTEHQLWDVLDGLVEAYCTGWGQGKSLMWKRTATAFVEGRLKKRKNRGEDSYKVSIDEPLSGTVVSLVPSDYPGTNPLTPLNRRVS